MSSTEKEALEAGTVWWESELFSGNPNWDILTDTEIPKLTDEEQKFIDGPVQELCEMTNDYEINQNMDLPQEIWNYLKDNKFFGLNIKKQYGGLEFSAYAQSEVISILASRSLSLAITAMVPNSLGPGELLHEFGTELQQRKWLPDLAIGKEIPAFALTGPTAGSDAGALPDDGVVEFGMWEGKETLGVRLNWDKRYITLGPIATIIGLAFRLHDPHNLLKVYGESHDQTLRALLPSGEWDTVHDRGITLALIPRDTKGVEIGSRHSPARQAFMNGPNYGKDVFIPIDHIIGEHEGIGKGWMMLMQCLAAGRAISLPSLSMAGLKHTARVTTAYTRIRKQFKVPIGKMEGIEEPMIRILANAYAVEAACDLTYSGIDSGHRPSVISALLKYQSTARMRDGVNDGMDILAGKAISDGPSNFLLNMYIGQPIAITVEGANILTRSLIVFSQGALRCHPFLQREIESATNGNEIEFRKALSGHIKYTLSNVFKSFGNNCLNRMFVNLPKSVLNDKTTTASGKEGRKMMLKYYKRLGQESRNFALLSDITLMILGGALKRKQKISGRFADILSEMYIMSAVLKRFEHEDKSRTVSPIVEWNLQNSLFKIQGSFDEILNNYPNSLLGGILRKIIFPLGRRYKPPSDDLGHDIVRSACEFDLSGNNELMLYPESLRNRIISKTFLSKNPMDPLKRLEEARLTDDEKLCSEVIGVDKFVKKITLYARLSLEK
jgi:acyl-CoA dehydrogenase